MISDKINAIMTKACGVLCRGERDKMKSGDKLSQTKVFLSNAYFKAATLENSVKGLKECGIGSHNPLMFSEHDFAAFKTTVHVVIGNETNSNRANLQSLVVENKHMSPPEEPNFMENADFRCTKEIC
ncbi:hypothetical protein TNCV_3501381 [Trichonephila clavipes]|uniref:Uncharacterized protein n=1 Tax=Trichonephila clavipes TaxID=2585209 RepID=A0A8X6VDM2_TRICX|nr:hypothetical protein TNCV_3501381 [Trichonephila clavipes]